MLQHYDNWTRFTIDVITLIIIVVVGIRFIGMNRPKDLKYVYIQMVLLFIAQSLYCVRSTYRVVLDDRSYFG